MDNRTDIDTDQAEYDDTDQVGDIHEAFDDLLDAVEIMRTRLTELAESERARVAAAEAVHENKLTLLQDLEQAFGQAMEEYRKAA